MFKKKPEPLEALIIKKLKQLDTEIYDLELKKGKYFNGIKRIEIYNIGPGPLVHSCCGITYKFDIEKRKIYFKFSSKKNIAALALLGHYLGEAERVWEFDETAKKPKLVLNNNIYALDFLDWTLEYNWLEEKSFLSFLELLHLNDEKNTAEIDWPDGTLQEEEFSYLTHDLVSLETGDLGLGQEEEESRWLRVMLKVEPELDF